ncbi:MAG: hypothetical protein AAGI24_04015 [Pseudomonadota bacterium]
MYIPPPGTAVAIDFERANYIPLPGTNVSIDFSANQAEVFDPTPVPGVIVGIATPWRPSAPETETQRASAFQQARVVQVKRRLNNNQAANDPGLAIASSFGRPDVRERQTDVAWGVPAPISITTYAPHGTPQIRDIDALALSWEVASQQPEYSPVMDYLNVTPRKDSGVASAYNDVDQFSELRQGEILLRSLADSFTSPVLLDFEDLRRIGETGTFDLAGGLAPNFAIQPKDARPRLRFNDGADKDLFGDFPWGPSGSRDTSLDFAYPDYNGPVTPPGEPIPAVEKETYYIMNTVNVQRVSDSTPIDMQNITISLDVDSWAWQLSGQVLGANALATVQPTASGLIDIAVEINGYQWIFMIESYSGSRAVADERYTVRGVSKIQTLASPYSDTSSAALTSATLANQVIDDILLNTGYTATFDTTPSWLIDAEAFTFQDKSPIQAIKLITDAAGAIIRPDRTAQALVIQPRFKVSPWALSAAPLTDIDADIPMAIVSSEALQFQPAPLYDTVYISGTNVGVANQVTRSGFPGTSPAPDVFDDLMTDTSITTERARQVIAASGNRGEYTLVLPVPEFQTEAPGLVEPGMIVQVVEGGSSWRGYCLGTSIRAPRSGAEKIEQTLRLVRFYEH